MGVALGVKVPARPTQVRRDLQSRHTIRGPDVAGAPWPDVRIARPIQQTSRPQLQVQSVLNVEVRSAHLGHQGGRWGQVVGVLFASNQHHHLRLWCEGLRDRAVDREGGHNVQGQSRGDPEKNRHHRFTQYGSTGWEPQTKVSWDWASQVSSS